MTSQAPPAPLTDKQIHDAEEAARVLAKFTADCEFYLPLWEACIARTQQEARKHGKELTRDDITKRLAESSATDLQNLNSELSIMLMRTSIIVAAATLLMAVFALKFSHGKSVMTIIGSVLLIVALLTTATAFIFAVTPLSPPFWRAWKKPYDKRAHRTLLVVDDFTTWVMNCWLGDRRTPIITAYKKAHAVAVPLLVIAAALTIPGLGISVIFH